ncbi:MAG: alpha-N-acetylglucosaminidase TIM-barrel domain-containing protein, partial [Clostridium sp.]
MLSNVKRHVAKVLVLTFMAGLTSNMPIEVKAATNKGTIQDVVITAKSSKGNNTVSKIMDGDIATYWESSNHYRWIEMDLGGTYSLSDIKIFNKLGGYYNYNVYASQDGENFIKVASKEDQNIATTEGDSHSLGNITATKLRIDVTYSSDNNDSNIAEIELCGEKISDEKPVETQIVVPNFEDTEWAAEYDKFENDKVYANQKTVNEMSNMVARVIGEEYRESFTFEVRKSTSSGTDVFEVEDNPNGGVIIRGNDGVSLASGFNYYLKNYAKVMYNPIMGSNLNMPETLPVVGEKIVVDTPYEYRYSLNFCTYSYTMSFWDWDEYEAFLDWSAMNGFNLILDIIGQEEVLRRTLNEFGYSDEEVKEYISGPAYFAWFYMQNMTSFGGPLPDNWFEDRAELGRKMHDRMQAYGIDPVLQGYSGGVPLDFQKKNPNAEVIGQGGWCGFDRPNMLKTYVNEGQEDYFEKVADVFYKAQKEVFGDVTNYYAVDPFHEGGNTGGLNDGKIYGTIQDKMIEHDEDSVWVIQHWQGNPSNAKVNGLTNKEQALILDLNSDLNPDYNRFDNLDVPWVWNMLHNFGGRQGLDGQPETIATKIPEALANTEHMKGIGITPEAINNSPIVYELIGDMVWTRDKIDFRQWTVDYIERRYGKVNEDIKEAWSILLETAYKTSDYYYQGAAESVINARPGMSINSASTWGHSKIPYNKKELERAVELFIKSYDDLKGSEAFIYDFLDVTKQLLANSAQEYHKELVAAYNEKDAEKFDKISNHFLELIKLQERILSTSPEFLVGTWIEESRTMLADADDWSKDLFEFNARALVTTWGDYKNGELKDYSNRQWAGLTGDLYLKRWELWINGLSRELNGGGSAPNINWYKMEYEWANKKTSEGNAYPTEGSGENLGELASIAMRDFSVTNMDNFLGGDSGVVEKVNIALGKPVEVTGVGTDPAYPSTNLTDGTNGTAWMGDSVKWPVSLTVDLQGVKNIDGIQFAPNQAAGGFPITYTIEVLSAGTWSKIAEQNEGTITGTIDVEYKGTAEKVRLNLNSTDALLVPELREIMIYEGVAETVKYDNVALGKPVDGSTAQSGKPLSNITDGDLGTLWVANGGAIPSEVIVDLTGEEYVEKIELVFEKSGLPFKFKVEAIDTNGNKEVVLDKSTNTEVLDRIYSIPVEKDITAIKVSFTGKANVGEWPGAWAALSEVKALRPVKEEVEGVNIALDKNVTGSNSEGGKPLSNITDGNDATLWVASGGDLNSHANVEFGKEYFIENVELTFEKAGLPFKFKVEAIDSEGNETIILDKLNNDQVLDRVYNIPVNKNVSNIKVTFAGKAAVGSAQGAWPAIAEVKAYSKPENVAINSTITPNEDGKMNALVDGDVKTSVNLTKDDNKEFVINFVKKADIYGIETIKSSNEALKYKIEYTQDNENWITLIDKLANDKNVEVNLDMLDKSVFANAIKVTVGNENITLNELKVYKADVTSPLVNYISKVEKEYSKVVVGEYAGNYPESAKNELAAAIAEAKEAAKTGLNSEEVVAHMNKLKSTLQEFYGKVVVINRIKLASLISDVELVLNNLSTEKIEALSVEEKALVQSAIDTLKEEKTKAVNVYETVKVTQAEIDGSYNTLKTSLDAYIEVVDAETAYNAVLEIAENRAANAVIGQGNGQYSQESLDELKFAIAKAKEEFAKATTVEEFNSIKDELKVAVDKFEESVNVVEITSLQELINIANEELISGEGINTPQAIEDYRVAIELATTVLNNINASQTEVNAAVEVLLTAQDKFNEGLIVNKDELATLIVRAKEIINELNKYDNTEELVLRLETIVSEAERVHNDDNATEEVVNGLVISLETIILEAEEKLAELKVVDKSELQVVIDKANALNKKYYTTESYSVLENALENAKSILAKEDATESEVSAAIALVKNAINNLVKIQNDGSNNGGNGNGENNNGGSNNGGNGNGENNNGGSNNGGNGNGENN